MSLERVAWIIGIGTMVYFLGLVALQACRYFRTALGLEAYSHPSKRKARRGAIVYFREALLAFVLSRMLILAAAAVYAACTGRLEAYLTNFWGHWVRWDANHYLGLMKNWYVTEGDARLHLVFFPLYPLMGRILCWTGMPALTAALLISNAALIGSGWVLGLLAEERYGQRTARRSIWLLMFCPVSFFFSMPYTESLFLLVTLLAVWMARKKRFGWAVFFGALAANARSLGIIVAIPIFWEMLRDAWEQYAAERGEGARRTDGAFLKQAALRVLWVLPVSAGLVAYLLLNVQLHGNPFQFLIYQKMNWSQEMGSLAETVRYTLINALTYSKRTYQLGVWIPQILTIFGAIALMTKQFRRQHPGDAAYGLVYFYLAVAPTWLLSGTRYVAAMYCLYPMLAQLGKGRRGFAALLLIEAALLAYMSAMGIIVGYVL